MDPLTVVGAFTAVAAAVAGASQLVKAVQDRQPRREFETSILYSPRRAQVDIVFVHGISPEPRATWVVQNQNNGEPSFWPVTELMPKVPGARIMTYDYNAGSGTVEYVTSRTLLHQTGILIQQLARRRRRQREQVPIIFVAHGLGGVIVKNALVAARNSTQEDLREVGRATLSVVFLDTPSKGSPAEVAKEIRNCLSRPAADQASYDDVSKTPAAVSSTTLAYSLERFKPLGAQLKVHAFYSAEGFSNTSGAPSEGSAGVDMVETCTSNVQLHKEWIIFRREKDLCSFSNRDDQVLQKIISSITELCRDARQLSRGRFDSSRSTGNGLLYVDSATADTGSEINLINQQEANALRQKMVPTFDFHVGNCLPSHDTATSSSPVNNSHLKRLQEHFESLSSELDIESWPVAILYGEDGLGKTRTALQYAQTQQKQYNSILWVNATSRASIELSFREISQRLVQGAEEYLEFNPTYRRLSPDDKAILAKYFMGLDGIDLESNHTLSDAHYRSLVQAVTEWLEFPRKTKWLLVLDDLSSESAYPSPATLVGYADPPQTRQQSWKELMRIIPSTSSAYGHIVITTRECPNIPGPLPIFFDYETFNIEVDESVVSTMGSDERRERITDWWMNAEPKQQGSFALSLFLSDPECPWIPTQILNSAPAEFCDLVSSGKAYYPELEIMERENEECIRPRRFLLERGPDLLAMLGQNNSLRIDSIASVAWQTVSKAVLGANVRKDMIHQWDLQNKVVRNCGAVQRRCSALFQKAALRSDFLQNLEIQWYELAAACEHHSAFSTAVYLYGQEMARPNQLSISGAPGVGTDFVLQLDCARMYRSQVGQFDLAEQAYRTILDFDRHGGSLSKEEQIMARHQYASLFASKGMFTKASEQASKVLGLEDPYGGDALNPQVIEVTYDLASYLIQDGDWASASSLLQRVDIALEHSRGKNHPSTIAALEFSATLLQLQGELREAYQKFGDAWQRRTERLGENHPTTLVCRSRMASVHDLQGEREEARRMYEDCLVRAQECLGPYHPAVFAIRENLAICFLMQEDMMSNAEEELQRLKSHARDYGGLYPDGAEERVDYLLSRLHEDNRLGMDMSMTRRNTIGVGDLYASK